MSDDMASRWYGGSNSSPDTPTKADPLPRGEMDKTASRWYSDRDQQKVGRSQSGRNRIDPNREVGDGWYSDEPISEADKAEAKQKEQEAKAEEHDNKQSVRAERIMSDLELDTNSKVANTFSKFASERNMDSKAAGELRQMADDYSTEYWENQSQEWKQEIHEWSDGEEMISGARSVLDEFATSEVRELVNQPYIGNNPAIIRLLGEMAKELKAARR